MCGFFEVLGFFVWLCFFLKRFGFFFKKKNKTHPSPQPFLLNETNITLNYHFFKRAFQL